MQTIELRPDVKYLYKLYAAVLLLGAVVIGFGVVMGVAIGADVSGPRGATTGALAALLLNLLWLLPALALLPAYYRSLRYEIQDDEVIVHAGIITKSVKHVPYRTVTNLKVGRGPLDRLFGLGTLNIQTAGMSGQTGAEESLVGLPDVQGVYERVAERLRRYRGAMSPTQAEEEALSSDAALAAILQEVRAIRRAMEKQ